MSIQVRDVQTEEQLSLKTPSFGVTQTYNGKFVETSFQMNGKDIKLLCTSMITFNVKSPDFGFNIYPMKDSPDNDAFIRTLKIFDKLGRKFNSQKFYVSKTYVPLYTPDVQYPYDLFVSYGDEIDFKVGDGPIERIMFKDRQKIVNMLKPSSEGQQKVTNIDCEVMLSINTFTSHKTGKQSYRLRMIIVKLHIIPYIKPDTSPTKFTISLSDDDDSEQDPEDPEDDESEQDEQDPEEIEH